MRSSCFRTSSITNCPNVVTTMFLYLNILSKSPPDIKTILKVLATHIHWHIATPFRVQRKGFGELVSRAKKKGHSPSPGMALFAT